jgi:pimeloyl-ACP methyl ester carboxylesterase
MVFRSHRAELRADDGADDSTGFTRRRDLLCLAAAVGSSALAGCLWGSSRAPRNSPDQAKGGARPFLIDVEDGVLDDLRSRIRRTRWPDEVSGAAWDYGTNLRELRRLAIAWERFDWRRAEARLNAYPQFTAQIDDLTVHFAHCRGRGSERAMPIVLTHGWPSTFAEMLPLVDRLCNPTAYGGSPGDAFDVVVPSLPGYGFSSVPSGALTTWDVAGAWHRLMTETLGYEHYAAHGVDIGGGVTSRLARRFPAAVVGIHLASTSFALPEGTDESALTAGERGYLEASAKWDEAEGAYSSIQSTKPQTLAYGLNDSPMGEAGWIVEKYRAWSDCHGDLRSRFDDDILFTNLTIYWVTQTMAPSMRFYYAHRHSPHLLRFGERVSPPVAVADFAHELVPMPHAPRELVERSFNVARWTSMPRGGHFPAIEEPELLARDLREFYRPLRAQLR